VIDKVEEEADSEVEVEEEEEMMMVQEGKKIIKIH
jgi:hypothetical protein